ncbi:MAG: hypothetical protein QXK06_05500 [Candidatus Diapherotrites archaeon]
MQLEGLKKAKPAKPKPVYCMYCKREIVEPQGLYGRRFCSEKCKEAYLQKND